MGFFLFCHLIDFLLLGKTDTLRLKVNVSFQINVAYICDSSNKFISINTWETIFSAKNLDNKFNYFIRHFLEMTKYDKVNTELVKLSNWFSHNRLSLHYEKTEFIHFSKTSKNISQEQFSL